MGVSATCFGDLETFFQKLKFLIFDPKIHVFSLFLRNFFVILTSFFDPSPSNEVFGVKSFLLAYTTAQKWSPIGLGGADTRKSESKLTNQVKNYVFSKMMIFFSHHVVGSIDQSHHQNKQVIRFRLVGHDPIRSTHVTG